MNLSDINTISLLGSYAGAADTIFPLSQFIDKKQFPWTVWIQSIQFSTSLTVFPSESGGMFLTIDQADSGKISLSSQTKTVIAHFTRPNSIPGSPRLENPSSKVSNITFNGCGYKLVSNSPIALYAWCDATAGNFVQAVASIQYRRES